MTELGFDVLPGEHPIVPVMIGDERRPRGFADALVEPASTRSLLVPGRPAAATARIRTQMSAAHTEEDIEQAVEAFVAARAETAE